MSLLIGADEAGYGPNLGPLVVALSVWRVPNAAARPNLYELLKDMVARDAADTTGAKPKLAIGDSKQLYDSSSGLGVLELGVLAARRASRAARSATQVEPTNWREAWNCFDPTSSAELTTSVWHKDEQLAIPVDAARSAIASQGDRFREACEAAGLELVEVRARGVFPDEFNRLVDHWGNKAEVLSHVTIGLVRDAIAAHPAPASDDGQVWVSCDKHGGRNHYAGILQHFFPDPLVEVRRETRAVSTYRWREGKRKVEVEFRRGGESELAVALASMTAKYLRELAMRAFNAFWQREVPNLRPTAGYPTDARRFQHEIAQRQEALGIANSILWRTR